MKKILSLIFVAAMALVANAQNPVDLGVEVDGNKLTFTFTNNSGKEIANCNFKVALPEGVDVEWNKRGTAVVFEKGIATKEMNVDFMKTPIAGKYSIVVYKGIFWEDEESDNVILSVNLVGEMKGVAQVTEIAFGAPDATNICRPADFEFNLDGTGINGVAASQANNDAIYNLAGQRVNNAVKGIFIQNGKKIMK